MNVEQLHQVLQQSFSADAAVRHPAEETIRNLKHLPGAVQLLLQVAAEKQVSYTSIMEKWALFVFVYIFLCVTFGYTFLTMIVYGCFPFCFRLFP
jgi:hypothetical protein